jgi:hypothetical protein
MDSDPDRKQEMHPIKNHPKISNLIIKKYRYALKYHEKEFLLLALKERIFRVGSETGSVTFY